MEVLPNCLVRGQSDRPASSRLVSQISRGSRHKERPVCVCSTGDPSDWYTDQTTDSSKSSSTFDGDSLAFPIKTPTINRDHTKH